MPLACLIRAAALDRRGLAGDIGDQPAQALGIGLEGVRRGRDFGANNGHAATAGEVRTGIAPFASENPQFVVEELGKRRAERFRQHRLATFDGISRSRAHPWAGGRAGNQRARCMRCRRGGLNSTFGIAISLPANDLATAMGR